MLAVLFFIPAMNLAGIPPFSGFVGKVGLLQAGVQLGTPLAYVLVVGGVATSLLTLYAMAKVWNRAFWRGGPEPDEHGRVAEGSRMPSGMVATAAVLVVIGVGITFIAGPLYAYTQRAAADLESETAYVHAVLPPEVRR